MQKAKNYKIMIVYKKTDEWYIEWYRMTTSDNKWQQMTASDTTSDSKWQRMTKDDNE